MTSSITQLPAVWSTVSEVSGLSGIISDGLHFGWGPCPSWLSVSLSLANVPENQVQNFQHKHRESAATEVSEILTVKWFAVMMVEV